MYGIKSMGMALSNGSLGLCLIIMLVPRALRNFSHPLDKVLEVCYYDNVPSN